MNADPAPPADRGGAACDAACCRRDRADLLGIVLSAGCAVHCAAMPVLIAAAPALGESWLGGEAAHWVLLPLCAAAAYWSTRAGVRRHGLRGVPVLAAAGAGLLLAAVAAPAALAASGAGAGPGPEPGACTAACCAAAAAPAPGDGPVAGAVRTAVPFLTPVGGGLLILAHLLNLFAPRAAAAPPSLEQLTWPA